MYRNETQIIKLKDAIYYCNSHINALELELDEKAFKHKCIPQKKKEEESAILECIVPLILLTALAITGIIGSIRYLYLILKFGAEDNLGFAAGLMVFLVLAAVGTYYGLFLWKDFPKHVVLLLDYTALERKLEGEINHLKLSIRARRVEREALEKQLEEEEQERVLLELSLEAEINQDNLRKYLDIVFSKVQNLEKRIGAPEVIHELQRFGYKTIGDIAAALENTTVEKYVPDERTNYAGVLRNIMMLQDTDRYFRKAYKGGWLQTSYERMLFWRDMGIQDIERYLKEYDIFITY